MVFRIFKHLKKRILIQRILQYIFICPKAHSLFHIIEIIMTAQNDDICRKTHFPYPAYQLDSVHQRHGNIGYDHVGSLLSDCI